MQDLGLAASPCGNMTSDKPPDALTAAVQRPACRNFAAHAVNLMAFPSARTSLEFRHRRERTLVKIPERLPKNQVWRFIRARSCCIPTYVRTRFRTAIRVFLFAPRKLLSRRMERETADFADTRG